MQSFVKSEIIAINKHLNTITYNIFNIPVFLPLFNDYKQ